MLDTIVIGAGQAGLAVGYHLKKSNQNFIMLEKGSEVGASWKERYDSLVLFTPRSYSALPGLPFSGDKHGFPTKDHVVSYLKEYVSTYNLPIHHNEEVISVLKKETYFLIKTNQSEYDTKNVVIATGPFQTPVIPASSRDLSTKVKQLHSSQYQSPKQLVGGNVLIVGGGNSGAQIAVELSKERSTYLAISKTLTYMPLVILNRSIFWWFDKLGILKASNNSLLGRIIQKKGDPVFGFDLKQAIQKNEVNVKNRVIDTNQNQVIFEDNSTLEVNNIIWATGYKTEFPWLHVDGVVDRDGNVLHERGITNIEGIYFIGLPWQHRRGSALLQGVGYDAEYIVNRINESGNLAEYENSYSYEEISK